MPDYDVDALRRGIEQCRGNIKTFEDAIEKERGTIATYKRMIETLEKKRDDQNRHQH